MELKLKDKKKPHHHHDHDHSHSEVEMTTAEKLKTLCDHWIKHNESHGGTYTDWADKASADGLDDSSAILKEIGQMTDEITKKMEELAKTLA